MRARIAIVVALVGLAAWIPGPAQADTEAGDRPEGRASAALDAYESAAQALLQRVSEGAPPERVDGDARALIALGADIAGDFAVLYPPCGPYLGTGLALRSLVETISAQELERDYHDGGALPDAPSFCYHALDLVVHPTAIAVLTREAGEVPRERVIAEIAEALANLAAARRFVDLAAPRR